MLYLCKLSVDKILQATVKKIVKTICSEVGKFSNHICLHISPSSSLDLYFKPEVALWRQWIGRMCTILNLCIFKNDTHEFPTKVLHCAFFFQCWTALGTGGSIQQCHLDCWPKHLLRQHNNFWHTNMHMWPFLTYFLFFFAVDSQSFSRLLQASRNSAAETVSITYNLIACLIWIW